jgi:hypothetical protein
MKTTRLSITNHVFSFLLKVILISSANTFLASAVEKESYSEYKGIVIDKESKDYLPYASLTVVGTNISVVSNSEGEFILKIPKGIKEPQVSVSYIGFKNKVFLLANLNPKKPQIELEYSITSLPEVSVVSTNAESMLIAVLEKRANNYPRKEMNMNAFYRETIKNGRSYVLLSEAIVDINKQDYLSYKSDQAQIFKARKSADYSKLDTIAFKLMGGPYNTLYLDIMKDPERVFTDDMLGNYEFFFDASAHIDNSELYVIDFKQKPHITEPLYYGKLYIDSKDLALKSAVFKLNVENRDVASRMFVMKKPYNANVYPTSATYRVDYTQRNGKWYYNYSRIELNMKINWKKRLFNSTYHSTIEMAATEWFESNDVKSIERKNRLKSTVVLSDEVAGFSDPDFWGEFNVIEPEKSIESAILKIKKQNQKGK